MQDFNTKEKWVDADGATTQKKKNHKKLGEMNSKQKTETNGTICDTEQKSKNKMVKLSTSYVLIRHTVWTITRKQH